jgi:hypothetical protein
MKKAWNIARPWNIAIVVLSLAVSPLLARETTIEATAPLAEHSDTAVRTAMMVAIGKALADAKTKGVRLVRLDEARVLEDRVTIRGLASDTAPDRSRANPAARRP